MLAHPPTAHITPTVLKRNYKTAGIASFGETPFFGIIDYMTKESSLLNKALNTFGAAPQAWKDYFVAFANLRKQVLTKIFSLDQEKQDKFLERMRQKERSSFSSVDDPHKYLTYHKSLGGSVGPVEAPNLDFEGEHSLLKFYEDLNEEIG